MYSIQVDVPQISRQGTCDAFRDRERLGGKKGKRGYMLFRIEKVRVGCEVTSGRLMHGRRGMGLEMTTTRRKGKFCLAGVTDVSGDLFIQSGRI